MNVGNVSSVVYFAVFLFCCRTLMYLCATMKAFGKMLSVGGSAAGSWGRLHALMCRTVLVWMCVKTLELITLRIVLIRKMHASCNRYNVLSQG